MVEHAKGIQPKFVMVKGNGIIRDVEIHGRIDHMDIHFLKKQFPVKLRLFQWTGDVGLTLDGSLKRIQIIFRQEGEGFGVGDIGY